ncbi:MAG: type II toxin-antitoxin system RelE/ParE family toxin [Verrucomicrobiia bacterium]
MNPAITISRRAEIDLTNQYRWYVTNAGVSIAEHYPASVDRTINRLAATPTLGRKRQFRASELIGIRSKTVDRPFSAYLIFYRFDPDQMNIERILHGARELGKRLTEEPPI